MDSSLGFWDLVVSSLPPPLHPLALNSTRLSSHGSWTLGNSSFSSENGTFSASPVLQQSLPLRVIFFSGVNLLSSANICPDGSCWRRFLEILLYPGLAQDVCATSFATALIVAWLRLFDLLARRNWIDRKLSRKVLHITIGLFFVLVCWPLFSSYPEARFVAAAAPVATAGRLALLGLGITRNEGVVKSMSREGSERELLSGPLCYAVTILLMTIVFWRSSPVGIVALVVMCCGDGVADIVGRRWGSMKLPWNGQKSWAGSGAMLCCGYLLSIGYFWFFCLQGFFVCPLPTDSLLLRLFIINLGCTLVESLPVNGFIDDNVTVPAAAVLLSKLLLTST